MPGRLADTMVKLSAGCLAAAAMLVCCGVASAQDMPGEPKLYEVRQTYALPVADYLSLYIDAYGANVTLENGPAGLVEAVFHVADTLHPPVFDRSVWADSGEQGSFQFSRPEDDPGAMKGELWAIRVPRDMDFVSISFAGFADVALWEVDTLTTYFTADSANLLMDLSSLESGRITMIAEARTGDIFLYVPRTADVAVFASCTLGVLNAPGFVETDLAEYAPEVKIEFPVPRQGRRYAPAAGGGAKVVLIATADRGDVNVVLVDP